MLQTLKADPNSHNAYQRALHMYPELLRDGYSRQQLKDIKKRMLLDAKSGAIKCNNKRLYVIPDWYAACEYYFCHEESPRGLLENGEVGCKAYRGRKVDVLRSPHLFLEHNIRIVVTNPEVYRWFTTDAIVTSCHDLISRVCQFDVDGDQLNVVADQTIVTVAERNIKEFDIVPLFYDASKAPSEIVSERSLYNGLMRAHKFSNIGEISNMLTRLWNRNNPNLQAAALLTALNNWRIDGAKNGAVDEYTNYPDVAKLINKATGGPHGRMPFFFQYSKNGRSNNNKDKNYCKQNKSTMNRICAAFDDIGNINMNWSDVGPFNYQMLLDSPHYQKNEEIVDTFCDMDGISISVEITLSEIPPHERSSMGMYAMLAEMIEEELTEKFGSLEYCYPFIVKALFGPDGLKKPSHKKMFWIVFGDIALRNLEKNLANCKVCSDCKMRIPSWATEHDCSNENQGFRRCMDCGRQFIQLGPRQHRCGKCQKEYRLKLQKESSQARRDRKKAAKRKADEKCTTFLQSHLTQMS